MSDFPLSFSLLCLYIKEEGFMWVCVALFLYYTVPTVGKMLSQLCRSKSARASETERKRENDKRSAGHEGE